MDKTTIKCIIKRHNDGYSSKVYGAQFYAEKQRDEDFQSLIREVENYVALADIRRRYFVITYKAEGENRYSVTGTINISFEGVFMARDKVEEIIRKDEPCAKHIVITNFIELTKDEYKHWQGDVA